MRLSPINVCVHDVTPATLGDVRRIFDAVRPLVGRNVSAGVIAAYRSEVLTRPFAAEVERAASEVLVHGVTHSRGRSRSVVSWVTGRPDEFAGLGRSETGRRLQLAKGAIDSVFECPAKGVLPPGWRSGRIPDVMGHVGLEYVVGMSCVRHVSGRSVPLATWSWDAGPVGPLGRLLDVWGSVLSWRRSAVPCVAIHPADVRRGYLPRAVELIRRLLDGGGRPASFAQIIEEGGAWG